MHVSKTLRRLAVVAATSSILGAVPFAAPALAGEVGNLSSVAEPNTGSFQVSFDTTSTYTGVPKPTVTFARDAAPSDSVAASDVTISGKRITVTVNLSRRNPGDYDIVVKGATSSPPAAETTDSCDKCFAVLAFAPTVTSPTPAAPVTLGAGASGVTFTVNGTNFTDAKYCTSGNCAGQPTLAVSPAADVTFTGTGTNGAVTNATPTAISNLISIAPTAQPGPRDIVVTNTDDKSAVCQGCLVVTSAPTLTKVEPPALGQGVSNATLVLTGTNFDPNVQVTISRVDPNQDKMLTYGTPVRDSATQITIPNVNVYGNSAHDVRRITVKNPDSGTVVSDTLFRINNRPYVGSVVYSSNAANVEEYGQGALNRTLVVRGANYQPGATVAFAPSSGITQNGAPVIAADGTTITLNVTLDQARSATPPAVGNHPVKVTNPDGGDNAEVVNFVVDEGPRLNEVTPASRGRGQAVELTLKGVDFPTTVADTQVEIEGVSGIVVKTAASDGKTITISGVTSDALNVAGLKDVTITNLADKGRDVCVGCFAIDNLQTNSMSPSTVLNDATQEVTVSGSGFAPDAVATFVKKGAGAGEVANITGTTKSVDVEGTTLVADFPFAGVAPGEWTLRVTNPTTHPGVGTCTCALTVVAPTPTITGLSRSAVGQGADDVEIEIGGTGFAPGAGVEFPAGVTVVSKTVTPTKITVVIDVAPNATPDPTGPSVDPDTTVVTVRNTDGKSASRDFDIVAGPKPTASDAAARAQGTVTTIKVSGSDFASGATLLFSGTGVTAGPTSFTDGTAVPPKDDQLASQVTVDHDAPPGTRTITVVNPDGGRGSCACFTVNAKPAVDSLSPDKGARGTSPSVTITGSGFTASSLVSVSGSHVAATVTAWTPTAITATFAVANEAGLGLRDVTVTNTDGGVATKAAAFKVFTVPGAPTGVTAERGEGSATVSWTPPVDDGMDPITEYVVTATHGGAAKTVPASETSATVEGLTNGTSYTFSVVARNAAGNGPASAASDPVTPATKPDAPTGVTATAGEGAAVVGWTAPAFDGGSPVTGYTVTSSPGGVQKTVTGTTATVDGLANGTEYTFTVVATNAVGNGAASAPSAGVTPFTVPDAPTGVSGTPADSAVNLQWTAPFDGGRPITGYTVTVTPGGTTKQVPASMTSAMVDGLANGTAYTFTVLATNERGAGPASAASDAVTPFTKPGAPKDVQATPADGQVTVTWTAPESDGGSAITGYVVTLSPGDVTKEVGADALSAVVTGLANGTAYTATVGATNPAGTTTSEPSAPVTPRTVPGAPTAVQAVRGDQSATVSWTAPESNGGSPITGYTVTLAPGGATKQVGAGETSTVVWGLTNGTPYTFTVHATNVAGDGPASAASNAVTPAGVPTAPSTVVATAGANGTASVSWSQAGANGSPVTSYVVTASPGGATRTVGAATRSTAFSGLTDGTPYTFAVRAVNAVGTGAAGTSNPATPRASTGLSLGVTYQIFSGGTTTLRGVLTKVDGTRLAGQQIRVYAKPAGASAFTLVRYLKTAGDGTYVTTFQLTRNTTFVTIFPGSSALMPYRSAERLTRVAYRISASYSLSGRTLSVGGAVSPNAPGRLIYLRQRRSDGSLVTIGQGYVQSNGTYRIIRTLPPGTYATFVHLPASSTNIAGNTPLRTVTIR